MLIPHKIALNPNNMQATCLAVSSTVSACGEEVSDPVRKHRMKPASVKQESSSKLPRGRFV
ncbi:MAG: hypothetical protein ORN29_05515 [Rhodoferax sp.]|nr:hypothetical protein [Rhodoferax sp.]